MVAVVSVRGYMSNRAAPTKTCLRRSSLPARPALNMIVVSEPSAKATQLERTGGDTPSRRRSSAARTDTPRYLDGRPISVHTEEVNRSRSAVSGLRRALLRDGPGWARRWWVTQGVGIRSRRHRRCSRSGVGSSSFSASGAPAGPRPQTCYEARSPTRRDTHFRVPILRRVDTARMPLACH